MAKRVSPTAIGVFVVASFALLVVAIIVVGSGRMFSKPVTLHLHVPGRFERPKSRRAGQGQGRADRYGRVDQLAADAGEGPMRQCQRTSGFR